MVSGQEISISVRAAVRLVTGDARAVHHFNATLQGFWNSLAAALIVAPVYAYFTIQAYEQVAVSASSERIVLVEVIAFAVHWLAFQLILYHYCQVVGRSRLFFRGAVALNWTDVPIAGLVLAIGLIDGLGILPGVMVETLSLVVTIATIAMVWYVSRVALELSRLAAFAPVGIAFLLKVVLDTAVALMVA